MVKIISGRYPARDTQEYLREVQSIVGSDDLWVAIKTKLLIQEVKFNGEPGYQLEDGTMLTVQGMSWNDMMYTGSQVPSYNSAIRMTDEFGELVVKPNFNTPKDIPVKIGYFEDVFKMGYIMFPMEAYKDFSNRPIIMRKGRRK